ncbi:hypothetical protein Bca101_014965 [Brassica carinata]
MRFLFRTKASTGRGCDRAEDETAKKDPTLQTSFTECHKAYLAVAAALKSANVNVKEAIPDKANYDVRSSSDHMRRVMELIGENTDKASTTLKE